MYLVDVECEIQLKLARERSELQVTTSKLQPHRVARFDEGHAGSLRDVSHNVVISTRI